MTHGSVRGLKFTPEKSLTELTAEVKQQLSDLLKVPVLTINPDKKIAHAFNLLKEKTPVHHNAQILKRGGELDVKTTKPLAARALQFMVTLIKALRARGHEIEF